MSKINRNNYEIYFIDHFDGRLNAAEESELQAFLELNPDLKRELEDFEILEVPQEKTTYPRKESLKKNIQPSLTGITDDNFEDYCIAYYEGDLNKQEQQALLLYLEYRPELKKDFGLYQKIGLTASAGITYKNKSKLKKSNTVRRRLVYYGGAIAASILLLFGIFSLLDRGRMSEEERMKHTLSFVSTQDPGNIESAETGPAFEKLDQRNFIEKAEIRPAHYREALALNDLQPISQQEEIFSDKVKDTYPLFLFQRFSPINVFQLHTEEYYAGLEQKDKSLAGRVLGNAFQRLTSLFNKRVDEIYENGAEEINLWNLAEAGIESYNVLADRDIKLLKHFNNKGELVGFALLGDNIEYYRKLK